MRSRLLVKLFAVLLATITVVVAVMLLTMRWSLGRGFLDYLNEVQAARVEAVVVRVEAFYGEHGSFDPLRQRPRLWRELVRDDAPGADGEPVPPHAHAGGPIDVGRRLTLFDADRRPVIGRARHIDGLMLRPLNHAGTTIGWLGLRPLDIPEGRELRFLRRQSATLYLIAAVMVLAAGAASFWLARRLQAPIEALARGARALTEGRFEARVKVAGRDEFGRLAADFNRLAETLEANESARRRWIADISHELRTPLAVLRGEVEALQDGVRRPDAKALASLHGEVSQLGKLVEDLYQLALSDLGALSYHQRTIEPLRMLDDAVAASRGRFAEADVALEWTLGDAAVTAFADPERLAQLFHNLLENSRRYTDRGGRLRITAQEADGVLHIDFQDSAPGVPPEALPRLFDRLYRVEGSRNRARGGAGLGLAIAHNIVAAHGGQLDARPSPLGGLWLRVSLPLHDPRREGDR